MRKSLAVFGLVGALVSGAASATTITNGDFESGAAGWTVTPVVYVGPIAPYSSHPSYGGIYTGGAQAAFFGAGDTTGGSLSQDLATAAGQMYTVSFGYGAVANPDTQTLKVGAVDVASSTLLGTTTATATGTFNLSALLSTYTYTFTALSNNTRLTFSDTSTVTTSIDGVLDNVSITAVPEASTITMMLGGLAMMGFMARRRRF